MFDIIDYAQKNKVSITVIPHKGKDDIGIMIQDGGYAVPGIIHPGREQEELDRLLASLGRRRAQFIGEMERSRRAAEIERFWRNE